MRGRRAGRIGGRHPSFEEVPLFFAFSDEAALAGGVRCFAARACAKPCHDVGYVMLDGPWRDAESPCYLHVAQALTDESEHLRLPSG